MNPRPTSSDPTSKPAAPGTHRIDRQALKAATERAVAKIGSHLSRWRGGFPSSVTTDGRYGFYLPLEIVDGDAWTSGFWPGLLWLAYEAKGDALYRDAALSYISGFDDRLRRRKWVDHHDLGFLYSLSCVAAHKLTGDARAKHVALGAADLMLGRFQPRGRFIQAWGALDDPAAHRLIIDSLMNLPLLYWASEVTNQPRYRAAAEAHLETTLANAIRPDASTFHTFYFDPATGAPREGMTHQGHSDGSCWARGQAWAIYGIALAARHASHPFLSPSFARVADYFLRHLPPDHVCYWDLCFTEGPEERDSSAAAIAVCGLLESLRHLPPGELRARCEASAHAILLSLIENYCADAEAEGLLLHAVYSKPHQAGVDECCIWGDYFYLEALVRLQREWDPYW